MNTKAARTPTHEESLARTLAAIGLMGVALIHFLDVFSKFRETPYLGGLYVVLMVACFAAVGLMLAGRTRHAWLLAAAAAAAPIIFYTLSRTTGLPSSSGDIGNWEEPLGLASLFVEGSLVVLSLWALGSVERFSARRRPGQHRAAYLLRRTAG
jgi:hypothetical protein